MRAQAAGRAVLRCVACLQMQAQAGCGRETASASSGRVCQPCHASEVGKTACGVGLGIKVPRSSLAGVERAPGVSGRAYGVLRAHAPPARPPAECLPSFGGPAPRGAFLPEGARRR